MRAVSKVLALAGAALLGVVAVAAGASVGGGERVASARTQAIIKLDQQYIAMKAAAAANATTTATQHRGASVGSIQSNTNYDYDTATLLFWHSVSDTHKHARRGSGLLSSRERRQVNDD